MARADLLRAGLGTCLCAGLAALVPLGHPTFFGLSGLALVFFAFAAQTEIKRRSVLILSEDGLALETAVPLPRGLRAMLGHGRLAWTEVETVQLRHYGGRRRAGPARGSFHLTLKGRAARLTVDDGQARFDRLAAEVLQEWRARGGPLDSVSEGNFAALGLNSAPHCNSGINPHL